MAHAFLPKSARLTKSAEQSLVSYRWPGNIRELKNTLWRAAILANGAAIDVVHLGLPGSPEQPVVSRTPETPRTLEQAERDAIRIALEATAENRTKAAHLLGIARSTLLEKLRKYGLE